MNITDLQKIASGVGRPIGKRIAELEARIARLESGEGVADAYKGAWRKSLNYSRGALVTHQGALWLCEAATEAQPGTAADWRLISKAGKPPETGE